VKELGQGTPTDFSGSDRNVVNSKETMKRLDGRCSLDRRHCEEGSTGFLRQRNHQQTRWILKSLGGGQSDY